jgi:hypothetical protein
VNKDINPRNNNNQRHGYWERYLNNKLWYKGFYCNSFIIGYEELYDHQTNKPHKRFYII